MKDGKRGEMMARKIFETVMWQKGRKQGRPLFSLNRSVWFTKPDSDKRSSEWWSQDYRSKGKDRTRFQLVAGLPSPQWLRDLFKVK